MLQRVFGGMMVISLVGGMISGSGEATVFSMLNAASEAVQTAIALTGAYAFFCGLLNIVRKAGVAEGLGKALFPALKRLFGDGLPADAREGYHSPLCGLHALHAAGTAGRMGPALGARCSGALDEQDAVLHRHSEH